MLWTNSSGSTLIVIAHVPGVPVKDPHSMNVAGYQIEFGVQRGDRFVPLRGAPRQGPGPLACLVEPGHGWLAQGGQTRLAGSWFAASVRLVAEAIVDKTVVGVLHPGEMGAAVGACLTQRGFGVLWASAGRGADTAARAAAAGMRDAGTASEMTGEAGVILSVCPPGAALEVARSTAGFRGIYVDANAVSPETAREVARVVTADGASYVDGGIIGAPPRSPGDSRLYLSGQRAGEISELFSGTALDARVMGDEPGAASAIKMAYAAWTKGTAALILAIRALARAEAVEEALLAEWELSQPTLAGRSQTAARSAAAKGWRWVAEMEEIAATMAAAGLPPGFHQAAAAVYTRVPHATNSAPTNEPSLTTVINALLAERSPARQATTS